MRILIITLGLLFSAASIEAAETVYLNNYVRAQTDTVFANIGAGRDALGQFSHDRALAKEDDHSVIRLNRDCLYSFAIIDLDAGPVTIVVPERESNHYQSVQVYNQDHLTKAVLYEAGKHRLSKEEMGTRYIGIAARTKLDSMDTDDYARAHRLQDGLIIQQASQGSLNGLPEWDRSSLKTVKQLLLPFAPHLNPLDQRFGNGDEIDPIQNLIGVATAFGGMPIQDAKYLNIYPVNNDGHTPYTLTFKSPPVDYENGGFWSVTVYNRNGFFTPDPQQRYLINDRNATKNSDDTVTIHFGGDPEASNFLPIANNDGWNYSVRFYRPTPELLGDSYTFPAPKPADTAQ